MRRLLAGALAVGALIPASAQAHQMTCSNHTPQPLDQTMRRAGFACVDVGDNKIRYQRRVARGYFLKRDPDKRCRHDPPYLTVTVRMTRHPIWALVTFLKARYAVDRFVILCIPR